MEVLISLGLLILGVLVGVGLWWLRSSGPLDIGEPEPLQDDTERDLTPPPEPVPDPEPVPEPTPRLERVRVKFVFANGGKDVKTLFLHSLADTLLWRRRQFARRAKPSPSGTVVYVEVEGDGR